MGVISMKKKVLLIFLAVLMVLTLTACSSDPVEGRWKISSGEAMGLDSIGTDYALVFKGGKITMEVDLSKIPADQKAQVQSMVSMIQLTYKLKSATEMEISMVGFGTQTVNYKVNGDTMTFGDATLVRVK